MSAVIVAVVIIAVFLVLLALGCYLDLCGDSSPGLGSGKSGLTPRKILPAGFAIAGLSAIAASRRQSSCGGYSRPYWSTTGRGAPAGWLGGTWLGPGVACAFEDEGPCDVGGGDVGGVCDV